MTDMAILYLSLAWLAGIWLGARFNWPLALALIALVPLPMLWFVRQRRQEIVVLSLSLLVFFAGAVYLRTGMAAAGESHLPCYNGQGTVEIRGFVSADREDGDKTARLRLSAVKIRQDGEWRELSGAVLLIVPGYAAYRYGDVLLAAGKLEAPPSSDTFDYRGYLANQGIYSIMSFPGIETIATGKGNNLLDLIYRLRHTMAEVLARVLPEPQASLAQGIVLGMRGGIPSGISDQFSHSGTAHLLAISGQNLSIVAGILVSLGLVVFGRRHYLYIWLALGIIWLYSLLTGLHAPVVRAAIMISFFFGADLVGRQRSSLVALVFAAALMAGVNPLVLRDASFQMSFMAMAGLFFITPGLQSFGRQWIDTAFAGKNAAVSIGNFAVDSLAMSLGAMIAVWPLTAYYFGIVSWIGPFATFLVMPSLPGIMVLSMLAGILGLFFLPLAQVFGWLSWLSISYLLLVVKVSDLAPFAQMDSLSGSLVWMYYGALALALLLINNRARLADWASIAGEWADRLPGKKWLATGLLVIAALVWLVAATRPDDRLNVTFLNIGQGDAILVQKGSQQILIDGGPSPRAIALALGRQMPFWDRTIDLVVLTHPHADHLTGLTEVLKRYRVKQVLYPDMEHDSPAYRQWLGQIEGRERDAVIARAGQRITLGEVTIDVLNPPSPPLTGTESDDDNNGVVLRLKIGEISFLLMADTMWEAELELIFQRAVLPSTVLKVGHHGSATSTSTAFLAVTRPGVAIISAGAGNDFGHPTKVVLARLTDAVGRLNIYRTDEQGDLRFTTDGKRLWVKANK